MLEILSPFYKEMEAWARELNSLAQECGAGGQD
jgi:hypothetical protein